MSLNRVKILWFSKQRNLWMVERRDGRVVSRNYLNSQQIDSVFNELLAVSVSNVLKKVTDSEVLI